MNFRLTLTKLIVACLLCAAGGTTILGTLLHPNVGSTTTYHAIFSDVSGLHTGDPVRVSGVQVGQVTGEQLLDASHVKVAFTANRDQQLTDTTYVAVRYANMLGQRILVLTQDGAPGHPQNPGEVIPDTRTQPALSLTSLFNGFQPLFQLLNADQINKFSGQLIDILQGQTGAVGDLITQAAQLTSNLSDRDDLFISVVDGLKTVLDSVAQHDTQLARALDAVRSLTASLKADGPNILRSLDGIDALMSSVNGQLADLQSNDLHGRILDLDALGAALAKNGTTIDKTIKALPGTFGTFNRVVQTGSWAQVYLCNGEVTVKGTPILTPKNLTDLVAGIVGNDSPTVLTLLGGLVPIGANIPLQLPQGTIGDPAKHTAVCR